jgi:penicillin-binding protein 2
MAVLVVVVCLFGTLLGRLWYLQGIEPATQDVQPLIDQGVKTIYVPAPRGAIFDRDGVLLAGNRIEQVVTVGPGAETADPGIVSELSAVLGEPAADVKASISNPQYSPYQPVPVAEGVSNVVVLAIDEHPSLFPGVQVQAEPVRYYPYATTTANIVGYVSQITGSEYAQVKGQDCAPHLPCYQTNSQFGQAGVEASMEKYLRGTPGKEVVQVDAQGHVLHLQSYTPPVPGDDLVLSISLTDQRAAVQSLNDWATRARHMTDIVSGQFFRAPGASMVVEDPRNGQVLALATYPDYNPSDFIGGISEARWAYYNNPKSNYPLLDRAISTGYAPGSTWKLITATAQLDYALRSPYAYYYDSGSFTAGNQVFADNLDSGQGNVDLQGAVVVSSDAYFYSLGYQFWQTWADEKSHPEYLQDVASQYGLGHYTGIDLPGDYAGIVPSQQVFTKEHDEYPKAYPDPYFNPGQEIQEAIGQGSDDVSPLQMADAYGAFANGGTLYVPQAVLAVEAPGSGDKMSNRILKRFIPQVKDHVTMPSASDRAILLQAFEGVTASSQGTAYRAFQNFPLNRYPVAGKTGTAQLESFCPGITATDCPAGTVPWPAYKQDTSVFTSFAPAGDPRFVVDAFFEQSGYGVGVAAPAVEQEYETLFGLNKPAHKGAGTANGTTTTSGPAG